MLISIYIYINCDLDLWPPTSKINWIHPLIIVNMSSKLDEYAHNGFHKVKAWRTHAHTDGTTAALQYPLRNALRGDSDGGLWHHNTITWQALCVSGIYLVIIYKHCDIIQVICIFENITGPISMISEFLLYTWSFRGVLESKRCLRVPNSIVLPTFIDEIVN